MNTRFLTALAIVGAASNLAAQSGAAPKAPPKLLTISGCVGNEAAGPGRFTLSDSENGTIYRLTGTNVKTFLGRRVQITGGLDSRRLRIVGGLLPSPNVAGQAGAIDPTQAAMAGRGGTGTAPFPTLRVTHVRALTGSCPER
jgi:hypothetical protein